MHTWMLSFSAANFILFHLRNQKISKGCEGIFWVLLDWIGKCSSIEFNLIEVVVVY